MKSTFGTVTKIIRERKRCARKEEYVRNELYLALARKERISPSSSHTPENPLDRLSFLVGSTKLITSGLHLPDCTYNLSSTSHINLEESERKGRHKPLAHIWNVDNLTIIQIKIPLCKGTEQFSDTLTWRWVAWMKPQKKIRLIGTFWVTETLFKKNRQGMVSAVYNTYMYT